MLNKRFGSYAEALEFARERMKEFISWDSYEYHEREVYKSVGWSLVHDVALPMEDRLKGAELVLQAWYDRSGTPLDFDRYVSTSLRQKHIKQLFPEEVFDALVEKYCGRL
ncbi:hypothetical protein DXT63_11885 [Thermoanaerobacteraceae bacterium SP2]|nr:hypothetical protein DXT63_11885 [Thermoanaerobacteraceae bacterium SP2]